MVKSKGTNLFITNPIKVADSFSTFEVRRTVEANASPIATITVTVQGRYERAELKERMEARQEDSNKFTELEPLDIITESGHSIDDRLAIIHKGADYKTLSYWEFEVIRNFIGVRGCLGMLLINSDNEDVEVFINA